MEEKENFLFNFIKLNFKEKNFKNCVLLMGVFGIFLIFISGFCKKNANDSKAQDNRSAEYINCVQKNLESIVSNIRGAGKTEVLVTLENGCETVYAKEEKKNKESLEDKAKGESSKTKKSDDLEVKYITVKESDGAEKALTLKELEPTVKGVVVVCEGGSNKEVRSKIIDAVKTALNIPEKRVFVTR